METDHGTRGGGAESGADTLFAVQKESDFGSGGERTTAPDVEFQFPSTTGETAEVALGSLEYEPRQALYCTTISLIGKRDWQQQTVFQGYRRPSIS
jgi:hypothetical protein